MKNMAVQGAGTWTARDLLVKNIHDPAGVGGRVRVRVRVRSLLPLVSGSAGGCFGNATCR